MDIRYSPESSTNNVVRVASKVKKYVIKGTRYIKK
uniref:Uncharacterized protein n=1 Tax=Megaviridae environmental sample TaxID=1737588 RepID=A0A5J6VL59_9VIRU|nr:MAG: hypothetical protein [Megaviridae environmental sample]